MEATSWGKGSILLPLKAVRITQMSFTLEPQEYPWLCMAYVGDVIQRVLAAGMRCVLTISTNV